MCLTISVEQLRDLREVSEEKDLDTLRWIGRNISLPKKFVEEIAIRAGIANKESSAAFQMMI